MGDYDHTARLARRLPLAREDLDATDAFETSFNHALESHPTKRFDHAQIGGYAR
jgi:hypothetical protein